MIYRQKVRVYDGLPEQEVALPSSVQGYHELWRAITAMQDRGETAEVEVALRTWCLASNYFMLRFVLSAGQHAHTREGDLVFDHPGHLECANRIQFDPEINNSVLIGARGWGKSSQLDADDIRALMVNPNFTICYFSLTKLLASAHLRGIQMELENNAILKSVFQDRVWSGPDERNDVGYMVPWSIASGILIKRPSSRVEMSIEAHAFENSLPAGMHYDRRRYDDIEAERAVESAVTAETIHDRWVSSQNLASSVDQRRVAGTYYAPDALMVKLTRDMGLKKLFYPGEDLSKPTRPTLAGPLGGTPCNGFSREALWLKLKKSGGADFVQGQWVLTTDMRARNDYARQIACDPMAGEATRLDWRLIRFYEGEASRLAEVKKMTIIVCSDCSAGMNDPTCIWVWGLNENHEFWWLDAELKVLLPRQRKEEIHAVVSRWQNFGCRVEQLRLEVFGQATYDQDQLDFWAAMPGFRAPLVVKCNDNRRSIMPGSDLKSVRGQMKTFTIWDRWQAHTSASKVVFPKELWRQDEAGNVRELVGYFKTWEFDMFPRPRTDNMLDSGKLIWEDPRRTGELPWPRSSTAQMQELFQPAAKGRSYISSGVS